MIDSRGEVRARTRPVSTVLSGQSTPHMIRSRATHHVIQSATLATFQVRSKCMQIPLSCNADLMLFTTKHVMYQVKVCFRDLLVCCYFPPLTWVGQGTPVMWSRFSRYHCLVTLVLWCLQLNTWFIRSKSVFEGLLVCWHFPALTWVGQGPHIMSFSHCNMHVIEPPSDLVLWHSSAECTRTPSTSTTLEVHWTCTITQHVILLATLATLQSSVQCTANSSYDTAHMSQSRTTSCEQPPRVQCTNVALFSKQKASLTSS